MRGRVLLCVVFVLLVAAAPAAAAGIADRIVVAEHGRGGTVYSSWRPDGSGRRALFRTPGSEVLLRSADGRHVLALTTERRYGLHLARVDGAGVRLIQPPELNPNSFALKRDSVALSPDGTRIAAIVRRTLTTPPGETFELVTVGADGGGHRVVVPPTSATPLSDVQWAPDGRQVAFVRAPFADCGIETGEHPDCTYTVELIAADASAGPRVIARIGVQGDSSYEIAPDGRRIAFPAPRNMRLTVARHDGSGARTLTRGPAGSPDWSPDGRRVRFFAGRTVGPGFFAFDRSAIVTVATGAIVRFRGGAHASAWSPDGRRLLGSDERSRPVLFTPSGAIVRRLAGPAALGTGVWEGGRRL